MDTAFVIGNGESRPIFPIQDLKNKGIIYGCNAIYRDNPTLCDHIVAVNQPMYEELQAGYKKIKSEIKIYEPGDINLRSKTINETKFSISADGYLSIINSFSGQIIKRIDIFLDIEVKEREKIKTTGFIIGSDKIYVWLNNSKIVIVDLKNGKNTYMKILKANNPKGTTPIVIDLDDLSNAKLRDDFNYDTMDGTMQRYKTYLKDSFDQHGMNEPIHITKVNNGRCEPYIKVPKGGNRCHWAKANGYTHIEAVLVDDVTRVHSSHKGQEHQFYRMAIPYEKINSTLRIHGPEDISKWNYICDGDRETDTPDHLKLYRMWRGGDIKKGNSIRTIDFSMNRGSGMSAVLMAAESGIQNVVMLAFDILGARQWEIDTPSRAQNNMYKNTINYPSRMSMKAYLKFEWMYQLRQIIRKHPDTNFHFINRKEYIEGNTFLRWYFDQPNIKTGTYADLRRWVDGRRDDIKWMKL